MNLKRLTLFFLLILAALGCERQNPPQTASVPASTTARPQRYQVFFSPHVRADTFLVDTQKGRVWVLTKYADIPNEPSAFDEIDIIDNTGEIGMKFSDFMQIYTSPQAAERKSKKSKPSATDDAAGKSAESKNAKK